MSITNLNKPTNGSTGWGNNVNQNFTDIENAFKGTEAGDLFLLNEQGSTPTTPSTGDWKLYFKSDGLYVIDDTGTEVGPLGTGGGSGGDLVLLDTITASSSSTVDFTSYIDSTYKRYRVEGINIAPATDNVLLHMRVHTGGAWPEGGTDYIWDIDGGQVGGSVHQSDGNDNQIQLAHNGTNDMGNSTGENASFTLDLDDPSATDNYKMIRWGITYVKKGATLMQLHGGAYYQGGTGAIDGLRFLFSSGNISRGVFKLYGIK